VVLGFADTAFRGVRFFPHRKFPVNAVRCVTNHDIDTARHCREMVSIAPQRMLHHAPALSTLDTSDA
jgi:4-alpha-glucanotransferase